MRYDPSDLGAIPVGDGRVRFRVWAPLWERVAVRFTGERSDTVGLAPTADGYHDGEVQGVAPGFRYFYEDVAGQRIPDPASRSQPEGVHGPSEVIDPAAFDWTDALWRPPPLARHVQYELHIGAFTPQGTFDGAIERLDALAELGVNAIEVMPIAQFPGSRNWGYDGVGLYAVQNTYGGLRGLQRFVDACHRRGMAVILDVVYNHLGPEGNCLPRLGPYFTERYRTPWGNALNFDGPESDHVRRFFINNALYWVRDAHVDGLRLDAVHAIIDTTPYPFVEELTAAVHDLGHRLGRSAYVIAESASNDPRVIRPPSLGGFGADAQWNDDFHHAVHALLTDERRGYYTGYGRPRLLAKAIRDGYAFTGERWDFLDRRHGRSVGDLPGDRFVVFTQNHDQTGNRAFGERLSRLVDLEAQKLAAGLILLSPFVPMLFMGEEYGETAPFLYFVSHTEPELVEAVRNGRASEFAAFGWDQDPPDPQAESTLEACTLNWSLRERRPHVNLLDYYRELIRLRRDVDPLARLDRRTLGVDASDTRRTMALRRWDDEDEVIVLFNLSDRPQALEFDPGDRAWLRLLDSADARWAGPGATSPAVAEPGSAVSIPLAGHAMALYHRGDR